ncbi:transcription initiation factor IIB, partial [Coemansia nantahalensis]
MSTAELAAPHRAILAPPTPAGGGFRHSMSSGISSGISSGSSSPTARAITVLCPDCRNVQPNLVHDFGSGELLCADCNAVVGDRLIDSRSTQPRGGPAMSAGLLAARPMRSRTQGRMAAQKCERQERNLARAFGDIDDTCRAMDLAPAVVQVARELFRRVEVENLHRGKTIDAVVATCIFMACRQLSVPRTFKEICSLTRVPRKGIGRTFKQLKEKLGTASSPMSSDDLTARFCANLSLLSTAQECAVLLGQMAKQRDTLAGKSPVSAAGACIYMASHLVGQPRDTKVISQVAGVSE